MQMIQMPKDAYPEQMCSALRDEFRRLEREQRARAEAAERRRAWRAALRSRFSRRGDVATQTLSA